METILDIIYIRTSTDQQNPKNQLQDIQSIAPDNCIIYEEKQSAWKDHHKERPKWKEIYELVHKGKVQSINVWDLDRIYRNRIKTTSFLQLCTIQGVKFRSFRQQYLTKFESMPPPLNEIMYNFMIEWISWMAEEESNKKSERVRAAFRKKHGVTYSYKGNKIGRKNLEIDVAEVLKLHESGLSCRKIAREIWAIKHTKKGPRRIHPSKTVINDIINDQPKEEVLN